ncbi:XRE family transcriptional regulator [Streptomyces sp. NBC_01443]|uniref:RICIN domain-containing protein n=1 Tax=Streptomyces sp. NBC_01443 TaxID=2903868 RepID=UPI0022575FD7|nr:XRE family transcriptional regulator [Streptomyces sp. NBC_01443]MCX4625527.1 XRE family transcriptional regulator [Streptomyces sp. NBC_01443]
MDEIELQPADIRSVEAFTAALRGLKARSGLTLRQLESRAVARGDILPRSTVADLLRKRTLPRRETVAAFVRACGEEDKSAQWLGAWERLASGDALADAGGGRETEEQSPPTGTTGHRRRPVTVVAAVTLVGALAAGVLLSIDLMTSGSRMTGAPANRRPALLAVVSAGSWARIRPAQTPELCLTAGKERSGRYRSEVAVQRPCADPGPRSFLQPNGDDLANIKWEHPTSKGMGCLTILDSGPAKGLVEPQGNCLADKDAQFFRIERFSNTAEGYRLRRAHTELCLGILDGETTAGAEAVQQPCGDQPAQRFLVDLLPQAAVPS